VIFLPNMIWQIEHDFVSIAFLNHIHARDIEIGRTDGYLVQQLFVSANLFTLPLWLAGLYFYFFPAATPTTIDGRYRTLGWMFVVPLLLFFLARGRFYYMAPAYPMLFAAGARIWEGWLETRGLTTRRAGRIATWTALGVGAAFSAVTMMPIAPINSAGWRLTSKIHDNFTEQIGWPELAATIARIYAALPRQERPRAAIFVSNYGEAGAINLYGRAWHLPEVISGINTYWWRGYGAQPPDVVILVGFSRKSAEHFAEQVELAGHITNPYGVLNEETRDHPDIFICRGFKKNWPEFWKNFQRFG
jgi:hypothetical protein